MAVSLMSRAGAGSPLSARISGCKIEQAANNRGHRIARQAQNMHLAKATVHQRLARTHGNLPEGEFHALFGQCFLHKVMITHRSAAQCYQNINLGGLRAADACLQCGKIIPCNAQIYRFAARLPHQRGGGIAVGADDRIIRGCLAGEGQFIAGGENADTRTVGDRQGCICLLYTSPSPRDRQKSRMPSSA